MKEGVNITYDEALNVVINSYRRGSKGGFGVCSRVLKELGDPHKKLNIIHVAGTNGKGSCCAFLRSILTESGYKTGMFTSPHLYRYNERYNIDGEDISDNDFAELVEMVANAFEKAFGSGLFDEAESGVSLSYFEFLTIMAFCYLDQNNVDFAIMETGMGGRADATNIVPDPILSVITSISHDHTAYLGNSIPAIAREKAGIIKKNHPVVLYYQDDEVYNVVKLVSDERNARLYYPENGFCFKVFKNSLDGMEFSARFMLNGQNAGFNRISTRLIGEYQLKNAANVQTVVYALRDLGYTIPDDKVFSGFDKSEWAGRMERLYIDGTTIILDGAHNPDGASYVSKSIQTYFNGNNVTLVAGILKEKDYRQVINALAEMAGSIILTQPSYAVKAIPPDELFAALNDNNRSKCIAVIPDYKKALDAAWEQAGRNGTIFISGSLYLVGDARNYLTQNLTQIRSVKLIK